MRKLILFDWDNTIVSSDYTLDAAEFKALINARQRDGWLIGLNSDTPFRRLYRWHKSLGMNGPIIAEKGAVIWSSGDALIETSETSEIFMQLRREIVDTLSRYPNISIFIGDNTGLIRSVKHLLSGDELLVAIDSYRRCSLGIFVRTIDDRGILKKSSQATDMIAGIIAPLIPEHPLISDFDPDGKPFGFLKVGPLDADKSTGLKALIETLGDVEEVVMVGDSMSDYIVLSDHIPKIHIFAVDNASSKFKDRADYVSSGSLVTGCVEILRHLKTYECRSS